MNWIHILAFILAVIVLATAISLLGQAAGKRRRLASDKRLARLLYKADRLKHGTEQTDEVEKAIMDCCEGHPEAWKGYRMLGELFIFRGNRSKSLYYFGKADERFPESGPVTEHAALWNELGGVAMASGKGADAMTYFLKASQSEPSYLRGAGLLYAFGWGEEKDTQKATEYFEKAIAAGSETAVANLYELRWRDSHEVDKLTLDRFSDYMLCCHCGRGHRAGIHALRESASRGYAPAQFELGTLYQHGQYGDDATTRKKEAFRWLRAAADQEYLPALHNLGFLACQQVIDPVRGDICRPWIKGTLLFRKEEASRCAEQGRKLIRQAAEAGYAPSRRSLGMTI